MGRFSFATRKGPDMADIDKIAVNNTTYNIKDSTARDSISRIKTTPSEVTFTVNHPVTSNNSELIFERGGTPDRVLSIRDNEVAYFKVENGTYTRLWTFTPSA